MIETSGLNSLGDVLEKAKGGGHRYIRRWKGKDGKWYYEYPDQKKPKPQQMALPGMGDEPPKKKTGPKTIEDVPTDVLEERLEYVKDQIKDQKKKIAEDHPSVRGRYGQAQDTLKKWQKDAEALSKELAKRRTGPVEADRLAQLENARTGDQFHWTSADESYQYTFTKRNDGRFNVENNGVAQGVWDAMSITGNMEAPHNVKRGVELASGPARSPTPAKVVSIGENSGVTFGDHGFVSLFTAKQARLAKHFATALKEAEVAGHGKDAGWHARARMDARNKLPSIPKGGTASDVVHTDAWDKGLAKVMAHDFLEKAKDAEGKPANSREALNLLRWKLDSSFSGGAGAGIRGTGLSSEKWEDAVSESVVKEAAIPLVQELIGPGYKVERLTTKTGGVYQGHMRITPVEDKSTLTKTEMGNNETRARGISDNGDGTFTALTFSQSKTFKTRSGAAAWLKKRGLNEDGSRIKTEATPEVMKRMGDKLQQIGKEMQKENFAEAAAATISVAEATNHYNEGNNIFNEAMAASKKTKKKADKLSILRSALSKVKALKEKMGDKASYPIDLSRHVRDLESRISGFEETSGKGAAKISKLKDRAYRDQEMASDQMNYQPKEAARLYNRAAEGWDAIAKVQETERKDAAKAKSARDKAADLRKQAKAAETHDPEKYRQELAAKNRARLVESGRAAPFHLVGGEYIERGVRKSGDRWIAINGDQVQTFDSETKAVNAMKKMGYDHAGNPMIVPKTEKAPLPPADEWQRRRNMPGVEVKYMTAGRASDVVLTLKGKVIGQKTTISTRGKDGPPSFLLPDLEDTEKSMVGLDALGDLLEKALPGAGVEGGSKTPPKEYREGGATKGKHYADPKNYKYPIDTEDHVRAAISYFSKPKNAGVYSESEQRSIWSRIRGAAKKFGIEVSKKSGPPSVEDNMEKSLYGLGLADRMVGTPFEADALRACKEQTLINKQRDEVYAKYRLPWEKRNAMDPVDVAKHRKAEEKAMETIRKKEDELRKVKDALEMKYLDWRIEQADAAGELKKALPSATSDISPEKARQILHDGTVHGKPLTEQQRKFFGAIGGHLPAPGKKGKAMKKGDDGKPGESLGETSFAELRQTFQDIKTRLSQKPDDKALQARYKAIGAELKRRGSDKGEGMLMRKSENSGLDELGDVLNKAGLPTHNWAELGHAKSATVDGGSADGGELEGVGKTSGSSDSGPGPGQNAQGQLTGVPSPKGDKFSEDDAEDEDQMKPHKKALERSLQKGLTPANQREAVAHESAVLESRLRKGDPDVTVGEAHPYSMDTVHGDTDRIAAGLLEDSFYHGRPPSLTPEGSVLRKSITCSCGNEYPAMLTACPACSSGTTQSRLLPHGAWYGAPETRLEKSEPFLRRPPEEADVLLTGESDTEE